MRQPSQRIVAAIATGPGPHRLLSGTGPEGPWCGAGAGHPLLAATAVAVRTGDGAARLDGGDGGGPGRTLSVDVEPTAATVATQVEGARARLEGLDGAGGARSWMVAILGDEGEAPAVWLGLGPPRFSVGIRCWPGIVQGVDAAGEAGATAPLAAAAEALGSAFESGHLVPERLEALLAPARAEAVAEGVLAERHARIMDADGDHHGRDVRRVVAQTHAVAVALAALRAAAGAS